MSDNRESYRLVVVRRAPIDAPQDLAPTLEWLVRTLQTDDPVLFTLSGLSPAMSTVTVLDGEESRVGKFLSTSEIEWNFGRGESDPTHEVAFFNEHDDARLVYLRMSFVATGSACTGPGFVAELRLGLDAAGPKDEYRGAFLDKLFSYLVVALRPNFGHIEIPGHPDVIERPTEYQVGWVTYLAKGEATIPLLEPPAVVLTDDAGTKILATRGLGLESYGDVAKAIRAVHEALHPPALPTPTFEDAQPAAPPMQHASYMGGRPGGAFASLDDERTDIAPSPAAGKALPFAQWPGSASTPAPPQTPPLQTPPVQPPLQTPPVQPPLQTPPVQPPLVPRGPGQPLPVAAPPSVPRPMTAPTFGLPPPLAPSAPPVPPAQPPAATPDPGPPRRLTVMLPAGTAPTPVDPNARPGGLPFAPKPGGQNDPNKR